MPGHQKCDAIVSSSTSAAGDLLAWVLGKCSDCNAEIAALPAPWIAPVSGGGIFVYSVRRGSCRLISGGRDQPLELYEGDTVVLPQCKEHQLQDPGTSTGIRSPVVQWFDPHHGAVLKSTQASPKTATTLLVSRFRKPTRQSDLLLAALPPYIIHRGRESESSHCVDSTLSLIENEIAKQLPDRRIIEHLTKVLILQVSRNSLVQPANHQCVAESPTTDDVIMRALGLMHARPDISWTVAMLATAVGISRSTFAARFVDQMDEAPQTYLRRARMKQAADLLADETLGIKEIAALVGYDSESAFSNAFKQWCGITPGTFRRERLPQA